MKKVSIVIPTYKRAENLERAIKSCLNQTYKNIEIIVVDDNVPDSEYAKSTKEKVMKYPEVIYVKNERNMGGALARNEGIKRATGEFIAFLDDDDEFLPTKIEKQLARYEEVNDDKCCMIYCYGNVIDGDKVTTFKNDVEGCPLYEDLLNNIAGTPYWFSPKDKLESVGGFDDYRCCQEGHLLLKLLNKGYTVYRVPEILLNVYAHSSSDGSGIRNFSPQYIEGAKLFADKCVETSKVLTKKQQKNIMQNRYYWIFNIYCETHNKEGMKEYFKKIMGVKLFNKITIKAIIKYYFKNK